ncbi:ubiquitin carboxyl-terminal hydrolase 37 [Takifugu rubripes]|uniref:ubiquitin carboxyl-terminal hydrolase 37 n=1 Tax=Takifugu rubripes TaxID=31033 RepID=UPI000298A34E|nr:ubiquitin carboxyl-terminal hydrolase 37 [Takifugu rubripes]XP_029702232.1 ubiquitin carboxyl-terminal hydrolase 37 [Takifugu rubripes]|eukprot:XP_003976082.1 PREDICTED: ubiquitin carboxyl-terminal hydrolase 37 [Takifugu rubripes]
MAQTGPIVSSSGTVQIRFSSIDLGTTKWREGTFEILEKDNKISLCLRFNCGTLKIFQLNQNLKTFSQNLSRIQLNLKDSSVIVLDKVPQMLVQRTYEYLKKLKQEKEVRKSFNGSGNFGVLGNCSLKNESRPLAETQKPPRWGATECLVDTVQKKPLVSPSRPAAIPSFTGLSENRNEKRKRPFQYISDLVEEPPKDQGSSRTSSSPRTTTVTGSNSLPHHSTPFKRIHRPIDYGGWRKPRLSNPAQPQPPLQGFSNLGNTCYMNAILQSLFSVPSFSKDMLSQSVPWSKVSINGLIRCFVHLLAKKDVGSSETKKDLLRKVKNAISSTVERFSGNMQNDAHEFLCQCLDQLKEEVAKVNKSLTNEAMVTSPVRTGGKGGQDSVSSTARSGGLKEVGPALIYTCPVVNNMEFEVQHTITCKSCGEVVTKHERFNDLSIDLPRRKKKLTLCSIQDSLDLFFRMEEIEYSCEKCSGKAATVSHKFSKLPRVLILHLKRYNYDPQLSLNNKLGQRVVIPRYLTLLSHCTQVTQPPVSISWVTQTSIPFEEEPWSSPDTGFEDTEAQDLAYITDLLETRQPADMDEFLDMTMDEDKENQTPKGLQWERDLDSQCNRNQEREEQELQQALTQSLMECAAQEMREEDDLRRATELSLQEFNRSLPEMLCSDDDSGNQDMMDTDWTEAEDESPKRNAESGDLANSFRLISVVSHIGGSSSSGHYISDVYDTKKQSWLTYNDLEVSETQEAVVQRDRDRSGYIFFYMHKDVLEQLSEMEKSGGIATTGRKQCCSTPVNRFTFKQD